MDDKELQDSLKTAEVKKARAFVKDKFYPELMATSLSIDDAKFLLGSFSNMIMQEFLALMREKKMSELNLVTKLDPESPQYEGYKKIVELFNDESIFNAKELIEGMKGEITMMIDNEMKERKLDTLKTNFLE